MNWAVASLLLTFNTYLLPLLPLVVVLLEDASKHRRTILVEFRGGR